MCGFYGVIGDDFLVNDHLKYNLSKTIHHRGPNDEDEVNGINFFLGFKRLSILDLTEAGKQPFVSKDGRYYLVFNGEIYNYLDLSSILPDKYLPLNGNSDTEVLFNLLIWKGVKALPLLNGMFSFVFFDQVSNTAIVGRDRLGVKPLFYSFYKNSFYFSSELPSLMEFGLPKEIDFLSLNNFIRFGQINSPRTIFKDIFKLEPGSFMALSMDNLSISEPTKWWDFPYEENYSYSENQWLDKIDELLFNATEIRMISDVPVGIFLSGGIDSSLIAHYSSIQSKATKPIAVSVRHSENSFNEFNVAQIVANSKNIDLVGVDVVADNLAYLKDSLTNIGEPFTDSSILNQYQLAKAAKKFATVFLSGDGGDESFAGYDEYVYATKYRSALNILSHISKPIYPLASRLLKDDFNFKQQLSKLAIGPQNFGTSLRINYNEPLLLSLLRPEYRVSDFALLDGLFKTWSKSEHLPFTKRLQILDFTNYLEPDVLVKVDRATMLNSIECRSPFLDFRLVELALKIPTKFNVKNGHGKYLLRQLAKRHLPKEVVNLPKKGFGVPYRKWLTSDVKNEFIELHRKNNHNFWNPIALSHIVANAEKANYDYYSIFWRLWVFELWFSQCFSNEK